jgi:hypothetical protein
MNLCLAVASNSRSKSYTSCMLPNQPIYHPNPMLQTKPSPSRILPFFTSSLQITSHIKSHLKSHIHQPSHRKRIIIIKSPFISFHMVSSNISVQNAYSSLPILSKNYNSQHLATPSALPISPPPKKPSPPQKNKENGV